MKTKKTLIPIITLCAALSLTACSGSGSATTESSQKTQTEATTEAADNSNTKLDDLYQQENQIFADHADVWNKVFGTLTVKNGCGFLDSIFVSVKGLCVDTYYLASHRFDGIV